MEIIASNEKKLNMERIIIILVGFYQIRRYEDHMHTPYRFAAMKYHAF
jgi:hypothetical protein